MCRIGKNKWRWTFQTLCSFLVFSSIFLSPTTKYVLIAMHIYYLCWTSGSLGLLEVIGLLHRAESTILNRQGISKPAFKHWWYKAFTSDSLHTHCPLCAYYVHCMQLDVGFMMVLNNDSVFSFKFFALYVLAFFIFYTYSDHIVPFSLLFLLFLHDVSSFFICFIKFSNLNLIKRTLSITNLVILILYRNVFINTFILIIKPNYSFSNNCKPSFISYQ